MADLTITATNVIPGTTAALTPGLAGEAITAGQAVYRKASDGKYYKARAAATAAEATVAGIAVNGASLNQPLTIQTDGDLQIGAVTIKTTMYVLSATAGGICPQADLVTGNQIVHLGYAKDLAGAFVVRRVLTGVVV